MSCDKNKRNIASPSIFNPENATILITMTENRTSYDGFSHIVAQIYVSQYIIMLALLYIQLMLECSAIIYELQFSNIKYANSKIAWNNVVPSNLIEMNQLENCQFYKIPENEARNVPPMISCTYCHNSVTRKRY